MRWREMAGHGRMPSVIADNARVTPGARRGRTT